MLCWLFSLCLFVRLFVFFTICSTSPPGGNQVDGLPPAASFQLNDILGIIEGQYVESEKYDRSFVILRLLIIFKYYFNVDCISQTLNLFIMDSFRYGTRFSL